MDSIFSKKYLLIMNNREQLYTKIKEILSKGMLFSANHKYIGLFFFMVLWMLSYLYGFKNGSIVFFSSIISIPLYKQINISMSYKISKLYIFLLRLTFRPTVMYLVYIIFYIIFVFIYNLVTIDVVYAHAYDSEVVDNSEYNHWYKRYGMTENLYNDNEYQQIKYICENNSGNKFEAKSIEVTSARTFPTTTISTDPKYLPFDPNKFQTPLADISNPVTPASLHNHAVSAIPLMPMFQVNSDIQDIPKIVIESIPPIHSLSLADVSNPATPVSLHNHAISAISSIPMFQVNSNIQDIPNVVIESYKPFIEPIKLVDPKSMIPKPIIEPTFQQILTVDSILADDTSYLTKETKRMLEDLNVMIHKHGHNLSINSIRNCIPYFDDKVANIYYSTAYSDKILKDLVYLCRNSNNSFIWELTDMYQTTMIIYNKYWIIHHDIGLCEKAFTPMLAKVHPITVNLIVSSYKK